MENKQRSRRAPKSNKVSVAKPCTPMVPGNRGSASLALLPVPHFGIEAFLEGARQSIGPPVRSLFTSSFDPPAVIAGVFG